MAPEDQGFDESLLMANGLYLPEDDPGVVDRLGGQRLSQRPFQYRLGLRPGDEHARADRDGDRAERSVPGQVLQRSPRGAGSDQLVIAVGEPRPGVGERQPTAVGAGDVGGQQLGVDTWRGDAGGGQCLRRGVDQPAHRHRPLGHAHVLCNRACLSAAANASNSGSRSPSSTWSRLCDL